VSGRDTELGDRFRARVIQDVVAQDGTILVPRGSTVSGHVTTLRESRQGKPASVSLALDTIRIAGVSQPFPATVKATRVQSQPRDVEPGHVVGGTALGAILGTLVEPGEGTVAGAATGAAGGTLISLGMSRKRANLPAGTRLQVQLESSIRSAVAIHR
jgi:uncharacterized protein YcfJ